MTGGPGQEPERSAETPVPDDQGETPGSEPPAAGGSDPGGVPDSLPAQEGDMSSFEADVEDTDLSVALAQVDKLGDDLARAKADLYNLNQEYGNYVRRTKEAAAQHRDSGHEEVVLALIGVLDDIDAARAHGELGEGPFASIAQKLEDTLSTRFNLERFGQAGDDFDPQLHEALLAQSSAEVDHPVVKQVLQPGYRMGEKVLRPTKVMVENPE